MNRAFKVWFLPYLALDRSLYLLFFAYLLVEMVSTAFLFILNIHLKKLGYSDGQIGVYTSLRYLGILLLAFPLGLFIRGRRLKPLFYFGAVAMSLTSLGLLEVVALHDEALIYVTFVLWGACYVCMTVGVLPFYLRHSPPRRQSEALALLYTNFSLTQILTGVLINLLRTQAELDEAGILRLFCLLGFGALPLLFFMKDEAPPAGNGHGFHQWRQAYDWRLLFKALIPTAFLTIGAGLTIPFMNVFFFSRFQLDSAAFSTMSAYTAVLSFFIVFAMPIVRKRYGYKVAITYSQMLAVALLFCIAWMDIYAPMQFALAVSICCYMLRQPFMYAAVPLTRELVVLYVGPRNKELVSAMVSSIRSGSYFVSGQLFALFRVANLPFYHIFFVTGALYALGVFSYYLLIRSYERKSHREKTSP